MDKFNKINEAINKISSLGYKIERINNSELHFLFQNKRVIYYPIKEWASGASITDCRGLGKLLKQIKPIDCPNVSVQEIKEKLEESIKDAKQKSETASTAELYSRFDASADAFQFILDFINENQ